MKRANARLVGAVPRQGNYIEIASMVSDALVAEYGCAFGWLYEIAQ